jgi:hypothetical protein
MIRPRRSGGLIVARDRSGSGGRFLMRCVGATGIVLVCCHSSKVMAARPEAPAATCPSPQAIGQAVRTLLGRPPIDADGSDPPIAVRDLGDSYTVSVKGNSRAYRDAARDCEERVRAAAVFVALTLAPSSVEATEAAEAVPVLSKDVSHDVSHSWGAQLEVGALGAMAPRTDTSQFVVGGEARFVATAERWGLSLGFSLPTSSTFNPASVQVREARYPFDLGLRRFWTGKWLQVALDAGVLAALCQLRQVNRPVADTSTRFEAGGRVAATLATESATLGLYIRAYAEFIPFPRRIAVLPQGIIGQTSVVWMGATVGVAARFH